MLRKAGFFLDKRKKLFCRLQKNGGKIKTALCGFGRFSAFFLCFGAVLFGVVSMAKEGSDFFYYAMAFAAPGTAMEILESPLPEKEASSTDFEAEEKGGAQTEEKEHEAEPEEEKSAKEIPEVPENRRGKVTETQYSAKEGGTYVAFGNAMIKNCTHHSPEKIKSMLKTKHSLSLSTAMEETPQVLVYHTHATEGYEVADRGYFDLSGTWRSTDPSENMISVGEVLSSVLKEKGIGVIHDGTMHDDPSYNGSYKRSAVTISSHLSENEHISVCLDIHRDAIEPSEHEIMKPTAIINGKKAAQIMIIAGCDDGSMNMPDYWENLRFAAALADKLEELYPGICRPILFDYRKYNMDLSPGLLLIEIGATGNTLEEAQYSAKLLGEALFALLAE